MLIHYLFMSFSHAKSYRIRKENFRRKKHRKIFSSQHWKTNQISERFTFFNVELQWKNTLDISENCSVPSQFIQFYSGNYRHKKNMFVSKRTKWSSMECSIKVRRFPSKSKFEFELTWKWHWAYQYGQIWGEGLISVHLTLKKYVFHYFSLECVLCCIEILRTENVDDIHGKSMNMIDMIRKAHEKENLRRNLKVNLYKSVISIIQIGDRINFHKIVIQISMLQCCVWYVWCRRRSLEDLIKRNCARISVNFQRWILIC